MANLDHQTSDLDEEIDYNFFDDDNNVKSETNNNAVDKSDKSEIKRKSINRKDVPGDKNNSHNSDIIDINSSDELEGISSSSTQSSIKSSSTRSSLSAAKSHSSRLSNRSSSGKISPPREESESPHTSPPCSPSESDVTTVSSLDFEPKQKNNNRMKTRQNKNYTNVDNPEDVDRIQPEAILRAMIRIHEERRAMRHLRPKWIDPNTKDYSVSGLTAKMNLIPERIVSAPRKNIRDNPFYMPFSKPHRQPYHTAINREKELDRIEKENRAIYERIKKVQPSPGITKQELLKEYSKINRFSMPYNCSPYAGSMTTSASYRTVTASNSRASSQARRTHSSASINHPRSDPDQTIVSRKYNSNGRVMSANSLTGSGTRTTTSAQPDQRRPVKKSRY